MTFVVDRRQTRVSLRSLTILAFLGFLCLQGIVPSLQETLKSRWVENQADDTLHVYDSNADWEAWKKSKWYIEPFEEEVHSLPSEQLEFQRKHTAKDLKLYLNIIDDAVKNRKSIGSNARLIVKYAGKLLAGYLDYRRNELKLKSKYSVRPAFFALLANLIEELVDKSTKIKKEKNYKSKTLDVPMFQKRANELFTHIKDIIDVSPVGNYLKWNRFRLYMDNPSNPRHNVTIQDEGSDLFAQFRAMGYEGSTFLARRIVNMLRIFSKGQVPPSTSFF